MIREVRIPAGESLTVHGPIYALGVVMLSPGHELVYPNGERQRLPSGASLRFGGGPCEVPGWLRVEAVPDLDRAAESRGGGRGDGDAAGGGRGQIRIPPAVLLVGSAPGDAVVALPAPPPDMLDQATIP